MKVSVAVALPSRQEVIEIEVRAGATVADALGTANIASRFPELSQAAWQVGIWSQPCDPETALQEGDRIEVYRALRVDPKASRRARAARTGKVKPSPRSRSGR